jgi:hypothetical protein
MGLRRLSIRFSNSFDMIVSNEIGRYNSFRRIVSSWMLRRVALIRTDVSEELIAFFIKATRIGELGTTLT